MYAMELLSHELSDTSNDNFGIVWLRHETRAHRVAFNTKDQTLVTLEPDQP